MGGSIFFFINRFSRFSCYCWFNIFNKNFNRFNYTSKFIFLLFLLKYLRCMRIRELNRVDLHHFLSFHDKRKKMLRFNTLEYITNKYSLLTFQKYILKISIFCYFISKKKLDPNPTLNLIFSNSNLKKPIPFNGYYRLE